MKLREAIRTIVQEVVGTDLRKIVREILVEELMDSGGGESESPRSTAAKKAAATRAANRAKPAAEGQKPVPRAAKKLGLALEQKYKGKDYLPQIKGRIIVIDKLTDKGVLPRIIESAGKRTAVKIIGYGSFMKRYDRIE